MPQIVADVGKYVSSCPYSDSFTDVTGITSCTRKFVDNARTEIKRHGILHTEHATDFKDGKTKLISMLVQ